jgi:hypothetical protein
MRVCEITTLLLGPLGTPGLNPTRGEGTCEIDGGPEGKRHFGPEGKRGEGPEGKRNEGPAGKTGTEGPADERNEGPEGKRNEGPEGKRNEDDTTGDPKGAGSTEQGGPTKAAATSKGREVAGPPTEANDLRVDWLRLGPTIEGEVSFTSDSFLFFSHSSQTHKWASEVRFATGRDTRQVAQRTSVCLWSSCSPLLCTATAEGRGRERGGTEARVRSTGATWWAGGA